MSELNDDRIVPTPGGAQSKTPCLITFVIDGSGSMRGDKIGAALNAIDELLPHLVAEEQNNPVEIRVRSLVVGGTTKWLDKEWIAVKQYQLPRVEPSGTTPMGEAYGLILDELSNLTAGSMYPMVFVTPTDGNPTDEPLLDSNLALLKQQPLFASAIRVAVGIGTNPREDVLQKLSSDDVEETFTAHNAHQLVQYLKYVTMRSFRQATQLSAPEQQPPVAPPSILAGTNDNDILWG